MPLLAITALVFLASAAATVHWSRTMGDGMTMPGGWTLSMVWMPMGEPWALAGARFLGMWLVMMLAMMLPPLVPTLVRCGGGRLAALVGTGYFTVWAIFGAAAFVLGTVVTRAELASPALAGRGLLSMGGVFLLAGAVQLTSWKARQLARCRACGAPARPSVGGAFHHGLRYGVNCSLCCLGLMAVLLAGGMMQLAVVASVAAAVTLERLGAKPALLARLTGALVSVVGLVVIARAL